SPKGGMLSRIVEKAQISEENILFIDDNPSNLAEVKFSCPKLHVAAPEFLPELLAHQAFVGKDDASHSRLQQYKVLERKDVERQSFSSSQDFLKQSGIVVKVIKDLAPLTERLHELIERTNQLNFTKRRIDKPELERLISEDRYNTFAVTVKDNYG